MIVFNRQGTDPATLPEDVRVKLQLAREALIAGDAAEANHWLYAIACPSFACFDPYAAIEGRRCKCGPHDNLIRQVEVMKRLTQETRVECGKCGYLINSIAHFEHCGHGHVVERHDGMKTRCGGPSMCSVCASEQIAINQP